MLAAVVGYHIRERLEPVMLQFCWPSLLTRLLPWGRAGQGNRQSAATAPALPCASSGLAVSHSFFGLAFRKFNHPQLSLYSIIGYVMLLLRRIPRCPAPCQWLPSSHACLANSIICCAYPGSP